MVAPTNKQGSCSYLLLEVALQAQSLVALSQHPLIDRTVWLMAGETTFSQRFVFKNVWSTLHRVALETSFVKTRQLRATALDRVALVWFMARRAAHFSFEHRMVMRKGELGADFQMTLKTGFWRALWIHDLAPFSTRFDVEASRPVARFTSHVFGVVARSGQTRMRRRAEVAGDFAVTGIAAL